MRLRGVFTFILFIALTQDLFAQKSPRSSLQITEQECVGGLKQIPTDNTSHFGKIKDQGNTPHCVAFATTTLMEELNCEKNPRNCGKDLSAMDTAGCLWDSMGFGNTSKDGKAGRGTFPSSLIYCVQQQRGVCAENLATHRHTQFSCIFDSTSASYNRNYGCVYKRYLEKFDQACVERRTIHSGDCIECNSIPRHPDFLKAFDKLSDYTYDILLNESQMSSAKLKEEFLKACPGGPQTFEDMKYLRNRFLYQVLVPNECRTNRIQLFSRYQPAAIDYSPASTPLGWPKGSNQRQSVAVKKQMIAFLKAGFRENRSSLVSICTGGTGESCAPHAVVISGLNWDPELGCQIKLRNSWGEDTAGYSGWYNIDPKFSANRPTILDQVNEIHRFSGRVQ